MLASIELSAVADNTLYEDGAGGLSNGAGEHFFAGKNGPTGGNRKVRGLIAFDVAGNIPAGSTINSATLTLNMSMTKSGNTSVGLHAVSQNWGQGTSNAGMGEGGGAPATTGDATWLHTFFNTSTWTTPGGDFNATASATQTVGGVGSYTWGSTSQMVANAQSWLDSAAGNFGWLVLGNETAIAKRFDTRENPTPANRPQLTVDFDPPKALSLTIDAASISENGGTTTATVNRTDTSGNLPVNLLSNDTSEATVVASVVIADGQATSPAFAITGVDDALLDGAQLVTITASANGYVDGTGMVDVTDHESLTVSITAASISEKGGSSTATITRSNTDDSQSLIVSLSSDDTSEATVPALIQIPADKDSMTFAVDAVDDFVLDGTQTITIQATSPGFLSGSDSLDVTDDDRIADFGDAPTAAQSGFASSYPTLRADDGAQHLVGDLFLGRLIDSEPDGQPTSAADGDDNASTADEDGVVSISSLVASSTAATTSSFAVVASQTGLLDAWIDFNQDGDWNDTGEQIFTSADVVASMNMLSFTLPSGTSAGQTAARFRLSSTGGLTPTGAAGDGEVEDYVVTILDGDIAESADIAIEPPVSGTLDIIADGDDVVVRSGSLELFRAPGSGLNRIDVFGQSGDDTLNAENLDAIFSGLIGGDAGDGNDTLRLTGSGQELDLTRIADAEIQGLETIDITGSGDNTLTLDVEEVLNLSPTTDTLRVRHDDGDTVIYGDGWTVEIPQIVGGQFIHALTQDIATVQVVNTTPFRNPLLSLDVNRDRSVSPLDALIIINRLNTTGSEALLTPTSVAGLAEFFYIDTNGDRFVAPVDVIQIVNFLNDPASNPEGEFAVPHVDLRVVDTAGSVFDAPAADQDDHSTPLHGPAEFMVGPVAAKESLQHEAPNRVKRLTSGAEDEELVAAVDAFFGDFEIATL
ncbi:MAG: GEVED domain-containing protein [Planctomycetota bacterium]|nr:GEVED domain-containing protein [Planctomycetota bacterium]